jgi:hypothetical protein
MGDSEARLAIELNGAVDKGHVVFAGVSFVSQYETVDHALPLCDLRPRDCSDGSDVP